jgi:hypothetical protein
MPFAERELARRGRLVSVLLLVFLAIEAATLYLFVVVDDDHPAMKVVLVIALGVALVAAALNRTGHVTWAGMLLVALAGLPAVGIPATALGGKMDIFDLGAFYLLAGAELVAASVLEPASVFIVALLNSVIVIELVQLMPHTAALEAQLNSNNGPQVYAGPIALYLILALVAYLWSRSALVALQRADRAEELAALEMREVERGREIEEGVRQLLDVHVRLANGDFGARVPPMRNAELWRIGGSLNNLIARFARLAEMERLLILTQSDTRRIAATIRAWRAGQRPPWPNAAPPLDEVVAALNGSVSVPYPEPVWPQEPYRLGE